MEKNGIAAAIDILIRTIKELEEELKYERLCKENREREIVQLQEENQRFRNELNEIHAFLEKEGN